MCLPDVPSVLWFSRNDNWLLSSWQGVIGSGGHGRVILTHLSGIGDVALKELPSRDPHSQRELEAVCIHDSWLLHLTTVRLSDLSFCPLSLRKTIE
jgi:hypothetical protein